jgi:hypothetical protein
MGRDGPISRSAHLMACGKRGRPRLSGQRRLRMLMHKKRVAVVAGAAKGSAMNSLNCPLHGEQDGRDRLHEGHWPQQHPDRRLKVAGRSSKMYWPHLLEFVAAGVTEVSQQINRAVDDHFAQFDEALVGLQIGVQDFSDNIVGALDHRL